MISTYGLLFIRFPGIIFRQKDPTLFRERNSSPLEIWERRHGLHRKAKPAARSEPAGRCNSIFAESKFCRNQAGSSSTQAHYAELTGELSLSTGITGTLQKMLNFYHPLRGFLLGYSAQKAFLLLFPLT